MCLGLVAGAERSDAPAIRGTGALLRSASATASLFSNTVLNTVVAMMMALHFRRGWLQFNLRTMLAVMISVSVGLGGLSAFVRQKREERAAIKQLESLGGSVTYEQIADMNKWPRTARKYLGDDFLTHAVALGFGAHSQVQDHQLACIERLPKLRTVVVDSVPITDAGVIHCQRLYALRSLSLLGTKIDGSCFVQLQRLRHFDSLRLSGRTVTDSVLIHLRPLNGLRHLDLSTSRVTDAGMEHIAVLTGLIGLNLGGTAVTDDGLRQLTGLPHLVSLVLGLTDVTDEGVAELQRSLPGCTISY